MVKGLSWKSTFQHSKSLKMPFEHNRLILHLKEWTSFLPTDKFQWDLMTLLYLKSADAAYISYTLNVDFFFLKATYLNCWILTNIFWIRWTSAYFCWANTLYSDCRCLEVREFLTSKFSQ